MATNGENFRKMFEVLKTNADISKEEKELIEFILRNNECEFVFAKLAALAVFSFPYLFVDMIRILENTRTINSIIDKMKQARKN